MIPRSFRLLGLGFLLLGFVGAGCRPAGDGADSATEPVASAAPGSAGPAERADPDAALQDLLNRTGTLPIVLSPADRPRVVSEPAPDVSTWHRQVLERGHRESGFGDGPGSADARAAFGHYARVFEVGVDAVRGPILDAARAARAAGSRDPFLRYLELRYGDVAETPSGPLEQARGMVEVAHEMFGTRHHPLIQFIVAYRATSAARRANKASVRDNLNILVHVHMDDLVRDTNAPPELVFDHLRDWMQFSPGAAWAGWVLEGTEELLVENWSGSPLFHALMAEVCFKRAWAARGEGLANTVTERGWREMAEGLADAERHFDEAWRLNPQDTDLAVLRIRIELGQGRGRAVAERWFERAMALDPNRYDACYAMAYYLEPKWYGSEEECLRFARRCVRTEGWGGRVPLILVDVHQNMAAWREFKDPNDKAASYWRRPQVWADIQEAYEKFFRVNTGPDADSWRHNYARDAFLCGKHDAFLDQVGRFGGGTNHTFFGGVEKFEAMLAEARAAVGGGE